MKNRENRNSECQELKREYYYTIELKRLQINIMNNFMPVAMLTYTNCTNSSKNL